MSIIALGTPRDTQANWLRAELTALIRDVIANLVASGAWQGARLLPPG
jgi:hypothetical protein